MIAVTDMAHAHIQMFLSGDLKDPLDLQQQAAKVLAWLCLRVPITEQKCWH